MNYELISKWLSVSSGSSLWLADLISSLLILKELRLSRWKSSKNGQSRSNACCQMPFFLSLPFTTTTTPLKGVFVLKSSSSSLFLSSSQSASSKLSVASSASARRRWVRAVGSLKIGCLIFINDSHKESCKSSIFLNTSRRIAADAQTSQSDSCLLTSSLVKSC